MISRKTTGFLMHQVASTIGVVMLSAMSWYSTVELLKLIRVNLTNKATTSVLFGVPGFPFQAAVAFILGIGLARRLRVKSVVFVWILPLLWFCQSAVTVAPTSRLAYLIGEGCQATQGCFYQILFTLPLVTSILYSLGAVVSGCLLQRSSPDVSLLVKTNHA